jgi:hypothetical protein
MINPNPGEPAFNVQFLNVGQLYRESLTIRGTRKQQADAYMAAVVKEWQTHTGSQEHQAVL